MNTGMFIRHMAIRLGAALRSPTALFMLLIAGQSSLLLWPWFLDPSQPYAPQGVDLLVHLIFIFVWPMMLAFGTIGAATGGGEKGALSVHAMPALPIGRRSRALAEAASMMLLALAFRVICGQISLAWFGLREPITGEELGWAAFAGETALGALVMLPGVLAWVSLGRRAPAPWLQPLIVSLITFAALRLDVLELPVAGPAFFVVLAVAVLVLPDHEFGIARRIGLLGGKSVSCYRPGLEPQIRFRRDRWAGPSRRWGPVVLIFFVVTAAVMLRGYLTPVPSDESDFLLGLISGISFSIVGMTALFPMGVKIFQRDGSDCATSGTYCAAWSVLPVRPESVIRGVYVHGLVSGLIWIAFVVGFVTLSYVLGLSNGFGMMRFFLPLGLGIPAVAGAMTCAAVGDRVRGAVSLLALLCVLPVLLGTELAGRAAGLARDSNVALIIELVLIGLLGLVGGLPPLTHLRSRGSSQVAAPANGRPEHA